MEKILFDVLNNVTNLIESGRFIEAEQLIENQNNLLTNDNFIYLLALTKGAQKKHAEAAKLFTQLHLNNPQDIQILYNLATALLEADFYLDSVHYFQKLESLGNLSINALINFGKALANLNKHKEAIQKFDKIISLDPTFHAAYYNKSLSLFRLGFIKDAKALIELQIKLNPYHAEAFSLLGIIYRKNLDYESSISSLSKALSINPKLSEAYSHLGIIYSEIGQHGQALTCFKKALGLNSELEFLFGDYLHTKMKLCDWSNINSEIALCLQAINFKKLKIVPFSFLSIVDDPELQLKCAEIYATKRFSNIEVLPFPSDIYSNKTSRKIRIAYLSPDFREHPVSHLIVEVLESHNRDQFEVFGFYFGPKSSDAMHQRVVSAFDQYFDVTELSDQEISQLVRSYGIDIAIDLAGYTQHCRTEIFAHRCAPIQINYLGYPGTMGAKFMDYIIADKVVIPEEQQQFYSEKIIYLPFFQTNGLNRPIIDRNLTKCKLGLPKKSFIFCSFCNNYKYNPKLFDLWSEILNSSHDSVLWLIADNDISKSNIQKEFLNRSVSLEKILIENRMPYDSYLSYLSFADLFLDTFPFSSGTTASDVLWSGLPILTMSGKSFSSKMSSSFLSYLDLNELITDSVESYVNSAIQFATNTTEFKKIKLRLQLNLKNSHLFDSKEHAKNLDSIYLDLFKNKNC